MKLVNLTGREICIVDASGNVRLKIRPNLEFNVGCKTFENCLQPIEANNCHIKVVNYAYSQVAGMPDPVPGTIYIVSYAILQALDGERNDVVAPDTSQGSIVRSGSRVIGVQQFRIL